MARKKRSDGRGPFLPSWTRGAVRYLSQTTRSQDSIFCAGYSRALLPLSLPFPAEHRQGSSFGHTLWIPDTRNPSGLPSHWRPLEWQEQNSCPDFQAQKNNRMGPSPSMTVCQAACVEVKKEEKWTEKWEVRWSPCQLCGLRVGKGMQGNGTNGHMK